MRPKLRHVDTRTSEVFKWLYIDLGYGRDFIRELLGYSTYTQLKLTERRPYVHLTMKGIIEIMFLCTGFKTPKQVLHSIMGHRGRILVDERSRLLAELMAYINPNQADDHIMMVEEKIAQKKLSNHKKRKKATKAAAKAVQAIYSGRLDAREIEELKAVMKGEELPSNNVAAEIEKVKKGPDKGTDQGTSVKL